MALLCRIGEKLGMKSSKNVYISNKISVKDYGKPKILFSSLLLFYREKFNDFLNHFSEIWKKILD